MNSKLKENISAFVDNQCDDNHVIDKLKQDNKMAGCFGRYNLIGDAMRNDLPAQIDLDLSAKIAEAIDKEPVVLAPNAKHNATFNDSAAPARRKNNKVISIFRPAMQYGLAASFAAALVVGLQVDSSDSPVEVPKPLIQTLPVGGNLDPVSMQQVETYPQVSSYDAERQRQRINSYIMDHAQQLKVREVATRDTLDLSQEPVTQH
ncbi:sigma-E factor negative regulatory protein [Gayadomonas joobiniege]|uniref:sigma-E factor negative regulatory protein n=1 Tax=Gayadomonas joobiniege TaxID=1234606 RepID=UPI000364B120|nr:RseA family anti-sigma factor [Gayadomonas joobiniege]